MSKELKRSKCLEELNNLVYRAQPSLETSGRYIKALRQSQSLTKDEKEKLKYEYIINKFLRKHIIFIQEAASQSYGKSPRKVVSPSNAERIKQLAKSSYAVSDGHLSLVDVDGLKKMSVIKRAVVLKEDLVLPCKVKSENQKYKFNTQIIMSKDNVLGYATSQYEYDYSVDNINHNTLLIKIGNGILHNELLEKSKQKQATR